MLRLASLSTLTVFSFLAFAACGNANIAGNTGGGGNTGCGCGCGCAGGACHCTGGIPPTCVADADCGPACAGIKCTAGKCVPPVCTPGQDQTCNENPAMNAFAGTCLADATCMCKQGFEMK